MKHYSIAALLTFVSTCEVGAQTYTNFIRQVQVNSGAEHEFSVSKYGTQLSPLEINPGGARFELWTVKGSTLEDYFLDEQYVGAYVPQATLTVRTEDPYVTIPRTRADRPFEVSLLINELSTVPSDPDAARMVQLYHHVQSYGANGNGVGIDKSKATMLADGMVDVEGNHVFNYPVHQVPGADASKVRGEHRFTVMSLDDYQAPAAQLSDGIVQIWPVADGNIGGIEEGQSLRFLTPDLTVTLNDLYPDSRTYAHVYKGGPALGTIGAIVPGTGVVINDAIPQNRVLIISDWDSVIDESGTWTMELLTETPFGIDRLSYVTFTINRDIEVNGTVTTVE